MPKYRITAPTGETYEITAPEGASQDDVMAYAQQQHSAAQGTSQPSATVPDTSPFGQGVQQAVQQFQSEDAQPPSLGEQLGRAAVRTTKALAEGAASLPDIVLGPLNYITGGRTGTAQQALQTTYKAAGVPELPAQTGAERYADAIARGLGGTIGGVGVGSTLAGSASPTVSAIGSTLAASPGAQAAAATTGAASAQGAHEFGASPLAQLAAGFGGALIPGAAGAAANLPGRALGAALTPNPERQAIAQSAMARGIPLKASQVSDSVLGKYLDSVTGIVPGSGAKKFDTAQRAAFNNQIGQAIGAPDTTTVTPQVFAKARQDTSNIYNDLWNRNNLPVNQNLVGRFQQLADEAVSADPGVISKLNGYMKRIAAGVQKDDQGNLYLPGDKFKAIDSDMGHDAMQGGELSKYIGGFQDAVRDAMGSAMTPQDQALLAQANRQWGNQKTIAPLVAKAVDGNISPQGLMGAVTGSGSGKMAMATGTRGDLGDLARIGQLMKEPPQSGTEPRMMVRNFLGALGSAGGALAGGHILGPLGSLATGLGIIGGARGIQSALTNPSVVSRAAGMTPEAVPSFLAQPPSYLQAIRQAQLGAQPVAPAQ